MPRKTWRTIGIIIGVLAIIIIIVGPAGPLLARLGVKPICIQGELPHLRFVSCPSAQSEITPLPIPTLIGQAALPVIVDDDGSPDGMLALLFFLSNPQFDVRAVTISCGEAHPDVFTPHVQQLLAAMGRGEIPVGVGRATPLEGNNAFPDPWRQASDEFWSIDLPQAVVTSEAVPAAELIVDTIKNSPLPIVVFISGTHTNLAEALRLDSSISRNIKDVYIMGGSVYTSGNIHSDWPSLDNEVAEWNIWVDPVAADEVFSSGLPLHLIPLDATRRVLWGQAELTRWQASTSPESALASSLLQWMLNAWSAEGVYIWDLVAAIQASNPRLCSEDSLAIDVVTSPGAQQGQTVAGQGTPNVEVCLNPDSDQVKALAASVFGAR